MNVTRLPFRIEHGWCWWPLPGRLGIVYGDHFFHNIFSVRYGYTKIYHLGPLCIKWRPSREDKP